MAKADKPIEEAFITEYERDLLLLYRLCRVYARQANLKVTLFVRHDGTGAIVTVNKRNTKYTYHFDGPKQGLNYIRRVVSA